MTVDRSEIRNPPHKESRLYIFECRWVVFVYHDSFDRLGGFNPRKETLLIKLLV